MLKTITKQRHDQYDGLYREKREQGHRSDILESSSFTELCKQPICFPVLMVSILFSQGYFTAANYASCHRKDMCQPYINQTVVEKHVVLFIVG